MPRLRIDGRSASLNRGSLRQDRVVRQRLNMNYCLNCRRCAGTTGQPGLVLTECNIERTMLQRKFCILDKELFERHKNQDGILKAKLCAECNKYVKKETRLPESLFNQDWSIVWPAFIWLILESKSISTKLGINVWCIIPNQWRGWWLPQFQQLFDNGYVGASHTYPKQVIRDLTEKKEIANKLISELKLFDMEKGWDKVLECSVACPFGCCEFVHKTASLPLDIVIARAFDLTTEDMKFVTPRPANAIDRLVRGMRNDFLTFPMKHTISKLNNPDPEWEILPGLAFINGVPSMQVCRGCGNGSSLHFLYPPRNPFPIIPHPPYGDQVSPITVQSTILRTARANKYTNKYQMLHLQGHVNGVHTIRATTEKNTAKENQLSGTLNALALKGREDIKAYITSLLHDTNHVMSEESCESLYELEAKLGHVDQYCSFFESATYIRADVALKLEVEGKSRRQPTYSVANNRIGGREEVEVVTNHFTPIWPRVIPYVHAYNQYGCKFPSLYNCRSDLLLPGDRILWLVTGLVAMVQPVWDAIALKDNYKNEEIDGFFLSFVSITCFSHLRGFQARNYPFKIGTGGVRMSQKLRIDMINKFESFDAVSDDILSVLNLVLSNAANVKSVILAEELIDLNADMAVAELQDKTCLVCTTRGVIGYEVIDAIWELRFVSGTLNGQPQIFVRHGGEELCGWWNVQNKSQFVSKADLPILSHFSEDTVLVFVKRQPEQFDGMRERFLESIGGQSTVFCSTHKKPLVVHAKFDEAPLPATGMSEVAALPSNALKCCCQPEGKECMKRVSFCCPINECYTSLCTKHMKDMQKNASVTGDEKVYLPCLSGNNENQCLEMDADEHYNDDQLDVSNFMVVDLEATEYVGCHPCDSAYVLDENERFPLVGFLNYEDVVQQDDSDNGSIDPDRIHAEEHMVGGCFGSSTTASLWKPTISRYKKNVASVSGAVILNNCGTLLARGYRKLRASTWQDNFLQTLVATIPGRSIPLLYAEGSLFPTIFWKDDNNCSILGAVPTALLACDKTLSSYGIASLPSHLKNRIRTGGDTLCSKNQDYLCFAYDSIANLSCRGEDTRLVLRRGGMIEDVSIKKEDKSLLFDSDSIESRPHVNQLCAKMRDSGATYFGSHSANQRDHFGLKSIKDWLDSDHLFQLTINELKRRGCTITETLQIDAKKSIMESSTIVMLRHWHETTELYMKYICHSQEQPLGKVVNAWYRHEYQESAGNLSHLHFLLWIDPSEDQGTTLQRIRGSYLDFISPEEIEEFLADGMKTDEASICNIQDLAKQFLTHLCSKRCMKRKGKDGELRCRVSNNGLESPAPYKHVLDDVNVTHTEAATALLADIGLLEIQEDGKVVSLLPGMQGQKHYPPSRAADGKFSPCNNRLFVATKSNQNLTYVTGYFASRYVAKYSAKIDESNRVYVGAGQKEANVLTLDVEFLHNTKITGSKINEEKKMARRKDKNHPTGRAISIIEMMQATLGYDMVFTDIVFERLPTKPLGERAGVEVAPRVSEVRGMQRLTPEDLSCQEYIATYVIRNHELKTEMEEWQQHSPSETIIMRDMALSNVSIDKITIFGTRPPEIRFVQCPELYYKWFYRSTKCVLKGTFDVQLGILRKRLSADVEKSSWIDGFGHGIYVRPKAVTHVLLWLQNMSNDARFYCKDHSIPTHMGSTARDAMFKLFEKLQLCHETGIYNGELCARFFGPCMKADALRPVRDIPIIWFDPVPPTQGHRFVIHMLLSMGSFDNEMNLLTHQSMRQCFQYAGLIRRNINNEIELILECRVLLRRYVLEQLLFQPCGTKQFDRFVVAAWQVIKEAVVRDVLPFREMPSYLYTQLSRSIEESETNLAVTTRRVMAETVLDNLHKKGIDTGCNITDLLRATIDRPVSFAYQMDQGNGQSDESYFEQTHLLVVAGAKYTQYMSGQHHSTKGLIINGGPGTGKTTLMELMIIHALSLGLRCVLTAVLAERASELGGTHISQLMCIPVRKTISYGRLAEMSFIELMKSPEKLSLLRKVDIIFIDEFGQVSAQSLSTLDMIMRRIRNSSQFMGGVLIMATYDYLQLPPVQGHPPLLSPHMLTSFTLKKLEHSVRAGNDPVLRVIQDYTRLSPLAFASVRSEFISRIVENCTFAADFDDEAISASTLRMFGKQAAVKAATEKLLAQMKRVHGSNMRRVHANDQESSVEGVFVTATSATSRFLTTQVKEPSTLWMYPKALYQITYNQKDQFNQGQLAILLHVPDEAHVDSRKPIEVLVAPPGCKSLPSDLVHTADLEHLYSWKKRKVGLCADRIHIYRNGIQAKRLQYGLKPRIASTIHSGMGQDLPSIVTRVTSEEDDRNYNLWSKEQVIVLLSRTHYAKDIMFVGDPQKTALALADCLQRVSQYTDYMAHIMNTLTSSRVNGGFLDPYMYSPFRMCDYHIPSTQSSFCYHLVSLGDVTRTTSYIGETNNLAHRLAVHNQGQGARTTRDVYLIPWALLGFVSGFEDNGRSVRQKFENDWKAHRNGKERALKRRLTPNEIGGVAIGLIQSEFSYGSLTYVRCGRVD